LRSNGGGSLIEAIELTGLFIKTGPVVQVKDKRRVEVDSDDNALIAWNGPLGIMIDRLSASASEETSPGRPPDRSPDTASGW
jgi:carboxyl-terminal processing protease